MGERFIEAKEEFVASVSRGGLSRPSDYIYIYVCACILFI